CSVVGIRFNFSKEVSQGVGLWSFGLWSFGLCSLKLFVLFSCDARESLLCSLSFFTSAVSPLTRTAFFSRLRSCALFWFPSDWVRGMGYLAKESTTSVCGCYSLH